MRARPITAGELAAIPWTPIQSTQIEAAAWLDELSSTALGLALSGLTARPHLLVWFRSKPEKGPSVYAYRDAPKPVFDNLVAADSPGRQLNLTVKGAYEYAKLEVEGYDA